MKKTSLLLLTLLLCCVISIPCFASSDDLILKKDFPYSVQEFHEGYAVILKSVNGNYHYGLINSAGDIVIPPTDKYYFDGYVSDGMIRVKEGTLSDYKYGFMDTKGNLVVPCIYDEAAPFFEGLAAVGNEYTYILNDPNLPEFMQGMESVGMHYGFIDKKGNLVIPLQYNYVSDYNNALLPSFSSLAEPLIKPHQGFSEGLAVVGKDGKYGAIDKQGNIIIPLKYRDMKPFSDGLALVLDNGKYGFLDKNGNYVHKPIYEHAVPYVNGMTIVTLNGEKRAMDISGKMSIPLNYDNIEYFSEGLAVVSNQISTNEYKSGYIDTAGNLVIPLIYDTASNFSNGLARVGITDKRYNIRLQCKTGFINHNGETVVPLKYDYAGDFHDGYAMVAYNTGMVGDSAPNYGGEPQYGYIDTSGKEVIPVNCESANDFSEGIACMRNNSKNFTLLKSPSYKPSTKEQFSVSTNDNITNTKTEKNLNDEQINSSISKTAIPLESSILLNGKNTKFNTYNIEDYTYFKLRDLGVVLNGTSKQFEITWNEEKGIISLFSQQAYTGSNTTSAKSDVYKLATLTSSPIYLDNNLVTLTTYNIDGSNYFKLRDMAEILDFSLNWDASNNIIVIDTQYGYQP